MTDSAQFWKRVGKEYAAHCFVSNTIGDYVRTGDASSHTNTIEGLFSIFKRVMSGVYQRCQKKHLHRYLAELDFRYSNRVALGYNGRDRADTLLRGIAGKRLSYQTASVR